MKVYTGKLGPFVFTVYWEICHHIMLYWNIGMNDVPLDTLDINYSLNSDFATLVSNSKKKYSIQTIVLIRVVMGGRRGQKKLFSFSLEIVPSNIQNFE